jgi:hypothetical protein
VYDVLVSDVKVCSEVGNLLEVSEQYAQSVFDILPTLRVADVLHVIRGEVLLHGAPAEAGLPDVPDALDTLYRMGVPILVRVRSG